MNEPLTSNPLCAPTKEELNQFLTAWEGVGQLQTFTSREKFRKEARYFIQRLGLPEPPSAWQPIETAPHDREVLFWVVPLSADETYRDTSGNPITSGEKPRMMFCCFGRWSSLSKAIYWADVPGSPTWKRGPDGVLRPPGNCGSEERS